MPWPHVFGNVVLVAAAFALGFAARGSARWRYAALAFAVCGALGGFLLLMRPDVFVRLLPFADAVFYTNPYAPAVAMALVPCIALAKSRAQAIRIGVLMAALFGVAFWPYRYFWLPGAETERVTLVDRDGICRQTSWDTCGAAALVTLFRSHGVETTEKHMVALALTKADRGTWVLGQMRALRKILRETGAPFEARVRRMSVDELLKRNKPAIITAGLRKHPSLDTQEERDLVELYSWRPGVMHDVVFLERDTEYDHLVWIGDPDFGREKWRISQLRIVYQGYAVYLAPEND